MAVVYLSSSLDDRFRMKLQIKGVIFETPEFWGKAGFHLYTEYFSLIPYWLTWPITIAFLVGLLLVLKNYRKNSLLLLTLAITFFFIFKRSPLPRYFLVLSPLFIVVTGVAIEKLVTLLKKPKLVILAIALLFLSILPTSLQAFEAGYHSVIEKTAQYLDLKNPEDKFVFATYWPNIFDGRSKGSHYQWLTDSAWDAKAFGATPEFLDSLSLIDKYGGYAVVEDVFTDRLYAEMDRVNIVNSRGRRATSDKVIREYKEVKLIEDNAPNFPFSKENKNRVRIFQKASD